MSKNYRKSQQIEEIESVDKIIVEPPMVEEPKDKWEVKLCTVTYYNLEGKTIVFLFDDTAIQMSLNEFARIESGKVEIQYKGKLGKDIQFKI